LDRKQQKLSEYNERLQRLKCSLNELRAERLQIETDLQRRTRLEETKDELTKSNEALDRQILVNYLFFLKLINDRFVFITHESCILIIILVFCF